MILLNEFFVYIWKVQLFSIYQYSHRMTIKAHDITFYQFVSPFCKKLKCLRIQLTCPTSLKFFIVIMYCSPNHFFISVKRWQTDGSKFGLYGGWLNQYQLKWSKRFYVHPAVPIHSYCLGCIWYKIHDKCLQLTFLSPPLKKYSSNFAFSEILNGSAHFVTLYLANARQYGTNIKLAGRLLNQRLLLVIMIDCISLLLLVPCHNGNCFLTT